MSRNGSSWSSPLMLPQKGLLWATFPFFFSLMCSEKKNRRTAVFRAERSAEETAVSAKDSAASDAEPFAVAGTVPRIRQMPRPERRGWRSIFFFQSNKRTVKNSKAVIVLDEGNVHAWHGHIAKDKEESYGGQTHEDQRLVLPEHSSNLPS